MTYGSNLRISGGNTRSLPACNKYREFVRENKLAAGKAAPSTYGRVVYESHQGSQPMSVVFGC
jgi:hypothetical protein